MPIKDLEKRRAYDKDYRDRNPGYMKKWREYNPEYEKEWRKNNPSKSLQYRRKYRYGLTPEAYLLMLSNQESKCKICGDPMDGYRNCHVDHCHTTGKVRGLLCSKCNHGLGNFRDNPDVLQSAINYLTN